MQTFKQFIKETFDKSVLQISEQTLEWLHAWTMGLEGKANNIILLPNNETVKELSFYIPKQPITLYRSHIKGTQHSPLESWTHDAELAEFLNDDFFVNQNREIISQKFFPNQILVDYSLLPKNIHDDFIATEVVVAMTPYWVDRIKKIRTNITITESLDFLGQPVLTQKETLHPDFKIPTKNERVTPAVIPAIRIKRTGQVFIGTNPIKFEEIKRRLRKFGKNSIEMGVVRRSKFYVVNESKEPEQVVAAAIRFADGSVFTGNVHCAIDAPDEKFEEFENEFEDGFLTNYDRFITRDELAMMAFGHDNGDRVGMENIDKVNDILLKQQIKESTNLSIYNYQDANGERHVHGTAGLGEWEAAEFRYRLENAGDILREFSKYEDGWFAKDYIMEKINKIKFFLKSNPREHSQHSHNLGDTKRIQGLIKAYESQPVITPQQILAKRLVLELAKEEFNSARVTLSQIENFVNHKKIIVKESIENNIEDIIKQVVNDPIIITLQKKCNCTLTQGGCFAFASALRSNFGGDYWAIASRENLGESWDLPWATEHALVKIGNNLYDATGIVIEQQTLKKYRSRINKPIKIGKVKGWKGLWYPWPNSELLMNINEARVISTIFKKYLNH